MLKKKMKQENIYKGNKVKKVEVEEDDPFEDFHPDPKDDDIDEGDYEYISYIINKSAKGVYILIKIMGLILSKIQIQQIFKKNKNSKINFILCFCG